MTTTIATPALGEERPGCGESVKTIILYDDPRARERAAALCSSLENRLEGHFVLTANFWSAGQLSAVGASEHALEQSRDADLIMCSASSGALTPQISRWMRLWLERREPRPVALIGLAGAGTHEKIPLLHEELRGLAQSAGATYFGQTFPPASSAPSPACACAPHPSSRFPPLSTFPPETPRYGINE